MPRFDHTGPMGLGSQTGRKQGKCNSFIRTDEETLPIGRGMGCGRRRRLQNLENGCFQRRRAGERGLGRGFGKKQTIVHNQIQNR